MAPFNMIEDQREKEGETSGKWIGGLASILLRWSMKNCFSALMQHFWHQMCEFFLCIKQCSNCPHQQSVLQLNYDTNNLELEQIPHIKGSVLQICILPQVPIPSLRLSPVLLANSCKLVVPTTPSSGLKFSCKGSQGNIYLCLIIYHKKYHEGCRWMVT